MVEFEVAEVDAVYGDFQRTAASDPSIRATLDNAYAQLRPRISEATMGYCLQQYMGAELDHQTPGDRGLGRVSDQVPRLAAYFRKRVSALRPGEMRQLHLLIRDLVLRGYLVQGLMVENPPQPPRWTEPTEVYQRWIPNIYAIDPATFGPALRTGLEVFTNNGFAAFMGFLQTHSMRGGGLMSEDKAGLISMYYPLAGIALRGAETGS